MNSVNCWHCGTLNNLADETCKSCGAELRNGASGFNAEAEGFRRPATVVRPFESVGAALELTIQIFTRNIWLIAKLVFAVFAPLEIFKALSVDSQGPAWQVLVGTFLLDMLAKALIAPSLIYALVTVMRTGVAPGLNESYRWGLNRLWKVMACAVMAWALEMAGFVLLIVPGIILGLAFALIFPVATLENLGPIEILKRSYNLTKGHRGKIFLAGLLMTLICSLVGAPVGIVWEVLAMNGVEFWPLQAGFQMLVDIINEATTVLSLVFYLGILALAPAEEAGTSEAV